MPRISALTTILALAFLAISLWILLRQFQAISGDAVLTAIAHQPATRIALAILCTAVSFAAMASYDAFAVRIVAPHRIGPGLALLAGATANAISNTLGFHAVTASAVRYRLYARAGLNIGDISRIIALSSLAIGVSFFTMLAAASLAKASGTGAPMERIAFLSAGVLIAGILAGAIVWLARAPRTVALAGFRIALPSAPIAAVQIAIGAVDMLASIGALYVLLPPDIAPPFASFAIAMIAALALGVVSHTPGGLGVFEASVVTVLGMAGRADILAALVLYRIVYYLLPFALSLAGLAGYEFYALAARKRVPGA